MKLTVETESHQIETIKFTFTIEADPDGYYLEQIEAFRDAISNSRMHPDDKHQLIDQIETHLQPLAAASQLRERRDSAYELLRLLPGERQQEAIELILKLFNEAKPAR